MSAELVVFEGMNRSATQAPTNGNTGGGGAESIGGVIETKSPFGDFSRPCKFPSHVGSDQNPLSAIICVTFIIFGVVYFLFGYRCFKAIMFLTGCIFSTAVVYYVCTQDAVLPQYAIVGVSLCAGILFGLITMLVQYVGLFMTGFHTGLLLCLVSIAMADVAGYRIATLWTSSSLLMGFGVFFALITLNWKKGMTIVGSSLFGSAIVIASLDYFVEKLVMVLWIWEKALKRRTIEPCWLSWVVLALWPLVAMIGLVIQCAVTGKGVYHEKNLSSKKARANQAAAQARPRTRDQRAEMKQKKYRYLYQVRTAHGDVISQSYVQALQRKVIPGIMTNIGESSTLQSDATHLTTLPVDQQTQLPSSECNTVDSGVGVQYDAAYYNLSSRESIPSQIHEHCR